MARYRSGYPVVPTEPFELERFVREQYPLLEASKVASLHGRLDSKLSNWLSLVGERFYQIAPNLKKLSPMELLSVIFVINGQFHHGVVKAGVYKTRLQNRLLQEHHASLSVEWGKGRYSTRLEVRCGCWTTHVTPSQLVVLLSPDWLYKNQPGETRMY